ncbi:MAG: hypothetical protein BWY92_01447 [Firmicutes bacterium ADurb.BinA052]|nr:MAG: hypothetical protein BWY92_01447 [Firmicutes bacterium ADurb.BinA052]
MRTAQLDEAAVVVEYFAEFMLALPFELVYSVSRPVAVVVTPLRAEQFGSSLQERYPLRSEDYRLCEEVHAYPVAY